MTVLAKVVDVDVDYISCVLPLFNFNSLFLILFLKSCYLKQFFFRYKKFSVSPSSTDMVGTNSSPM